MESTKFGLFLICDGHGEWATTAHAQHGAPITYMFEGNQYIVVAIGGTDNSAEYVALSLP